MRRYDLLAASPLLLMLFTACQPTTSVGPMAGDDTPIVVGDTSTLPPRKKIPGPPYQFIMGDGIHYNDSHKQYLDFDEKAGAMVKSVYICGRPDGKKDYTTLVFFKPNPDKQLDLVLGKGSEKLTVTVNGSKVKIKLPKDPPGAANGDTLIATSLDLEEITVNKTTYKRDRTDDYDIRLVVHYCTTMCAVGEITADKDACVSDKP